MYISQLRTKGQRIDRLDGQVPSRGTVIDDELPFTHPQIDDDVGERDLEPLAGLLDHAALEPVGAADRVGREDQLVGAKGSHRIFDRLDRIVVSDLAVGLQTCGAHRRQTRVEPDLGGLTCVVLVGDPMPEL